ncbi:hypothetical protein, partial [Pasteurella multocida]|uniref:hypothetical protein n=1 Tax=Pasteurella multocida TaxID=747 RepID=UPI0019806E34
GAVAVFLSQCFIMLNHLTLDFGQSIILNKFKTAHFSGHHQQRKNRTIKSAVLFFFFYQRAKAC